MKEEGMERGGGVDILHGKCLGRSLAQAYG